MSKRSRPQPITAPAPESFLPSFDFGPSPKQKSSAPLPPRKPLKLTKRLAAFTFLNLEDIVEEGAANGDANSPPLDPLSPAHVYTPISTGGRTGRFWDFTRNNNKHSNQSSAISPISPASLPPMSSKAYATLVGGPTTPGSKPIWTPPASRVIRRQDEFGRSDSITSEIIELEAPTAASPAAPAEKTTAATSAPADKEVTSPVTSPKTLAVDLVSIFSLTASEEAEKTRFSFPMPPSFTPRRGSQSPLDPDMSFTSLRGSISSAVSPLSPLSPDSIGSTRSDLSFLSPLFSPSFVDQMFLPDIIDIEPSVAPDDTQSIATSVATSPKRSSKDGARKAKKRRSTRPVSLLPPAGPPPRESPPPTPTTPSSFLSATASLRPEAAIRACPSPDLDPELSSASSIHSVLQASDASASSESEPEEAAASASTPVKVGLVSNGGEKAYDGLFANWGFGAPSRSDSIVTITQRAYNAMRTSISNASSPRNGSWGSTDTYDNWDKAIDEIFALGLVSRKPSLASIAIAASADGAASANTTLDMVESMAFVMDDEMRRKLMESQFLVPSRVAPVPPVPSSPKPESVFSPEGTPSASATSSARSSMEEDTSFPLPEPVTPLHDTLDELEHALGIEEDPISPVAPKLTTVPERPKPTPLITSRTYPPVNPLRIVKNGPPSSFRAPPTTKPPVHPLTPTATHNPTLSPIERPPPVQGVPDEDPNNALSPLSGLRSPTVDIDSWPEWSPMDVEVALERRKAKHQSSSAATMISKFSDDSVEIRLPKTSARRKLKSNNPATASLSPGSSHTSYTFLGLKKKKGSPTSSPTSGSPPKGFPPLPKDAAATKEAAPRVSVESSVSRVSSDGKKNGLKRPPLPVELFIRA
ncbi:hypothetical protein CPB86DRAFT_809602 [Serendipita vermifera]|nr:hypothetical protein CPB86DRAFT_809602 [Serendipita vermifera]